MAIEIRKERNHTIITPDFLSLSGENAQDFKIKIASIIDEGEKSIQIELDKTNYIDSSGVGKLLFLNKKLEKLNGTFEISKISEELYVFLESLAITKVIKIAKP